MDISLAKVRIKPDRTDAFKAAVESIVAKTRSERGCLFYELYQSGEDPAVFYYVEQWETEADFLRHVQSQYVADFASVAGECEDGPVTPLSWRRVL